MWAIVKGGHNSVDYFYQCIFEGLHRSLRNRKIHPFTERFMSNSADNEHPFPSFLLLLLQFSQIIFTIHLMGNNLELVRYYVL